MNNIEKFADTSCCGIFLGACLIYFSSDNSLLYAIGASLAIVGGIIISIIFIKELLQQAFENYGG